MSGHQHECKGARVEDEKAVMRYFRRSTKSIRSSHK